MLLHIRIHVWIHFLNHTTPRLPHKSTLGRNKTPVYRVASLFVYHVAHILITCTSLCGIFTRVPPHIHLCVYLFALREDRISQADEPCLPVLVRAEKSTQLHYHKHRHVPLRGACCVHAVVYDVLGAH